MSIWPWLFSTCSTIGCTDAVSCRSFTTLSASTPRPLRCAFASASSPALRAVIATLAPISPRASAICSPSPREPPVISAVLPLRSNNFFTFILVPQKSYNSFNTKEHEGERKGHEGHRKTGEDSISLHHRHQFRLA